jgi:hypothetical protein
VLGVVEFGPVAAAELVKRSGSHRLRVGRLPG